MARDNADREDLLREATALIERVELTIPDFAEPIAAGFRRDGAASFFFGPDAVYQFNAARQLRRGFLDGKLYKADCGKLAALTPIRTAEQTELRRHNLTDAETSQFLAGALVRLQQLSQSLAAAEFAVIGQVPADSDVVGKVRDWLAYLPACIPIAGSPRV